MDKKEQEQSVWGLSADLFMHRYELLSGREWLVTNGRGSYASGTVSGANTRRYHGLLVSALTPPVGRVVMVSKLDEGAFYCGETFPLSANEFGDGTISPTGYHFLVDFFLDGKIPVWRYAFGDALIEKRIWMEHGKGNSTFVQYLLLRASQAITLFLRPLCVYRDYHWQNRGGKEYQCKVEKSGFSLQASPEATPYFMRASVGEFVSGSDWYWNFKHREEQLRGLDDVEDLFSPGVFKIELTTKKSVVICCSTEDPKLTLSKATYVSEQKREQALCLQAPATAPGWVKQLFLSADQFVVKREFQNGREGRSIIAGYHWFADWTRDTMISLPGLTLVTGRHEIAREILKTYASYLSEGMLPNRFFDVVPTAESVTSVEQKEGEYNSVDAALLYLQALYAYLTATKDLSLIEELFSDLVSIIECYQKGTRYNIHVDPDDHLLFAGEEGVQLTWMDAKVGSWVVTPRIGKPVEINALWFQALMVMSEFSKELGKKKLGDDYQQQAEAVRESFQKRFWYEEGGYLYDVVDELVGGKVQNNTALRPNQLFATGIAFDLLTPFQARQVVDICLKSLYTPYGLRSLSSYDPSYHSIYQGDQLQRDGSYHQGTVWPWLIGVFIASYLKVYRDRVTALSFLEHFSKHFNEAGLGSVSEIFDAEPPHLPRGCIAQAWSVGEILRGWSLCQTANEKMPQKRNTKKGISKKRTPQKTVVQKRSKKEQKKR